MCLLLSFSPPIRSISLRLAIGPWLKSSGQLHPDKQACLHRDLQYSQFRKEPPDETPAAQEPSQPRGWPLDKPPHVVLSASQLVGMADNECGTPDISDSQSRGGNCRTWRSGWCG